jgi:TDG/mug DNA glycosylase family protein
MNVLPDVLTPGLIIVFCGSAVGTRSAQRRAYYAGPGNAFWPTLFEVGLTPRRLEPEEYQSITQYGLGLTDLAKTIAGPDRTLSRDHFDREDLSAKLLQFRPRFLAFTSKRAAEEFLGYSVSYGLLLEQVGDTKLSPGVTSPACTRLPSKPSHTNSDFRRQATRRGQHDDRMQMSNTQLRALASRDRIQGPSISSPSTAMDAAGRGR